MKINSFTNYAFRALIYLGASGKQSASLIEIADAHRVSQNHLKKVLQRLTQHGFIETIRGRNGGYRLAVDPDQINVGEVFRYTQSDTAFLDCLADPVEGCVLSPACQLKHLFQDALQAFYQVLAQKTLADLLTNRDELIALLSLENTDD